MKLKKFNNFFEEVSYHNPNGEVIATHTFGSEEHVDFCETVSDWIKRNGKPVMWCLYGNPDPETSGESFGFGIQKAEPFWKQYVSGSKRFTLVEMDGRLIGVLHENGDIIMAFDEMDVKVEPSVLSGLDL